MRAIFISLRVAIPTPRESQARVWFFGLRPGFPYFCSVKGSFHARRETVASIRCLVYMLERICMQFSLSIFRI